MALLWYWYRVLLTPHHTRQASASVRGWNLPSHRRSTSFFFLFFWSQEGFDQLIRFDLLTAHLKHHLWVLSKEGGKSGFNIQDQTSKMPRPRLEQCVGGHGFLMENYGHADNVTYESWYDKHLVFMGPTGTNYCIHSDLLVLSKISKKLKILQCYC